MGAAWKTIPLFISSTFRDRHAERERPLNAEGRMKNADVGTACRPFLLKSKIIHDPPLVPHWFPYRLDWDDQTHRPRNEGADGLAAPLLRVRGSRPRPLAAPQTSPHGKT